MKGDPEQRALLLGEYIVEHGATVRAAARNTYMLATSI